VEGNLRGALGKTANNLESDPKPSEGIRGTYTRTRMSFRPKCQTCELGYQGRDWRIIIEGDYDSEQPRKKRRSLANLIRFSRSWNPTPGWWSSAALEWTSVTAESKLQRKFKIQNSYFLVSSGLLDFTKRKKGNFPSMHLFTTTMQERLLNIIRSSATSTITHSQRSLRGSRFHQFLDELVQSGRLVRH